MNQTYGVGYPSTQRIYAILEREGNLSPNRLPVGTAIDPDIFGSALIERDRLEALEGTLARVGSAATFQVVDTSFSSNGFGGCSKTRRQEPLHQIGPETEKTDTVRERMQFIDGLAGEVEAEIDEKERTFYTYEIKTDPVSGDQYVRKKYIYDKVQIGEIRQLEKEALEYIICALRVEALGALPRMRNYPSTSRLEREGQEAHVNIATLLSRLEIGSINNEHNQREKPWQQLIRSLVADLKTRYEQRNTQVVRKRSQYRSTPDWQDYIDAEYGRDHW